MIKIVKEKWLEAVLIIAIMAIVVFWIKLTSLTGQRNTTTLSLHSANVSAQTLITKEALDELIQQAANQKYIQQVFQDLPKLPTKSKAMIASNQKAIAMQQNAFIPTSKNAQQCFYHQQAYVPGDIVKMDTGWMRCMMNHNDDLTSKLSTEKSHSAVIWIPL